MQRTIPADSPPATAEPPPTLAVAAPDHWVVDLLPAAGFQVAEIQTGPGAARWVPDLEPDLVVLDAGIGRRAWPALCERMREHPRVANRVPILILTATAPSPDARVDALHAGAWGFLPYAGIPGDMDRLILELHAYLQAKRRVVSVDTTPYADPAPGVFRRAALARRTRELAALLTRQHASLACVVFAWDRWTPEHIQALATTARVSDVAGILSPTEVALVAPATPDSGAVSMAKRLVRGLAERTAAVPHATGLTAGFDAVANLKYTPIDPLHLLARAAAAATSGRAVPGDTWVRRFDPTTAAPVEPGSVFT